MAVNFPNSPNIGDVHSEGGASWRWSGYAWRRIPDPGAKGEPGSKGQKGEIGLTGDTGGGRFDQAERHDSVRFFTGASVSSEFDTTQGTFTLYKVV